MLTTKLANIININEFYLPVWLKSNIVFNTVLKYTILILTIAVKFIIPKLSALKHQLYFVTNFVGQNLHKSLARKFSLESLIWLQLNVTWGCCHLKSQQGWSYKITYSLGWMMIQSASALLKLPIGLPPHGFSLKVISVWFNFSYCNSGVQK